MTPTPLTSSRVVERSRNLSIWEKLDPDLVQTTAAGGISAAGQENTGEWRVFWKRRRPVLDALGSLLWLYAILKVFVADVDRALLGDLVDYRFFLFVALAVMLVLLLRRTGPIIAGSLYVIAFPIVIACWKLPKWLYKGGSPVAFLAAANAVVSVLGDIRHSVLVIAAASFASLAIVIGDSDVVLATGGFAMGALVLQAIARTVRFTVVPSRFMRLQQSAIRNVVDSPTGRGMMIFDERLRSPEVEKFDSAQQTTFLQNLGNAVTVHRAIHFWAHHLETYRRSAATLFFNALSYAWLLLRALVGLALINVAIYRADAAAYEFGDPPTFLVFLRYVIAGLYGGEIDAVRPMSEVANAISIATFVVGLVVAGSLLLSSALSFRASRNESEIRETIVEIKRQGDRLDERVRQEYEVSVEEATKRLEQFKFGLMGLIRFFSTHMPHTPDDGPPADASPD